MFPVSLERLGANARVASLAVAAVAVVMTLGLMVADWGGDISFYGATNDRWLRSTVGASSFPIDVAHWITGTKARSRRGAPVMRQPTSVSLSSAP